MVPFPAGPLGLSPEDPPAVAFGPPSGGLLHERHGVADETGDEVVLQQQQMETHSHVGAAAERPFESGNIKASSLCVCVRGGRRTERTGSDSPLLLLQELPLN